MDAMQERMGERLRLSIFLLLLLVFPALHAQETRVIEGRKFTVHVAEAGQTLFGIARSYAVPVDALLTANPSVQDGLSIGEEVLVPLDAVVKGMAATNSSSSDKPVITSGITSGAVTRPPSRLRPR